VGLPQPSPISQSSGGKFLQHKLSSATNFRGQSLTILKKISNALIPCWKPRAKQLEIRRIEAEARKCKSLRSCRKIVNVGEEQENGSNGLGEVPAPQFIHLYTQLQINFV